MTGQSASAQQPTWYGVPFCGYLKEKSFFFFLEVPEWCEVFLFYSFTKAMDI